MSSKRAVKTIVSSIQKLYPRALADSSWDNTGLLLECPLDTEPEKEKLNVLLTIDLTTSVVDEAIRNNSGVVMAYHPFIFRGLKSITQSDSQQRSLLRLARAGISVYCPHTAVDAAVGGVNDFLIDVVSLGKENEASREVCQPVDGVQGQEGAGMGRVVRLKEPITFSELLKRVKTGLGLKHVQVALTEKHENPEAKISSVAVCAGSGASVLRGVDADVHFTGELGHHEALGLIENGTSAIVCGHSNTERGYLKTFQTLLTKELKNQHDGEVGVIISQTNKDPLEIV